MKTLILIAALLQCMSAVACLGEAQIIATAHQVIKAPSGRCYVTINEDKITQFSENIMCPLDLMDVLGRQVEIKNCELKSGGPVHGVIIRDQNGLLVLE